MQADALRVRLHSTIEFIVTADFKRRHNEFLKQLCRALEVPNPDWIRATRMGRKGWGIPQKIRCYSWDRSAGRLRLPRGYLKDFLALAKQHAVNVTIDDQTVHTPGGQVKSRIQLRPYQVPAVEAMLAALQASGLALLESPPGSGKTEMALQIIASLGQRTLAVTHTLDLYKQIRDRAVDKLGLRESDIGLIGNGKLVIGRFLTIGLVQTLAKMDLQHSDLPAQFGAVWLDECHHSPAETWSRVIGAFPARYRFGVTGSLKRQDGLETVTHFIFGPTTYEIPKDAVQLTSVDGQSAGVLVPTLRTLRLEGEEYVPAAWTAYKDKEAEYNRQMELWKAGQLRKEPRKPQVPYNAILKELLANEHRNQRIVELLARITPGRYTLVLSARVEHCQLLERRLRELRPELVIATIHGQQPADVRDQILQRARGGEIDVLFSVNIAKEGLDLPILDQLVFVAGGRDPIYLQQAIGRIQRTHPGKRDCVVWDIIDESLGVFKAQWWSRRRVYQQIGMLQRREARQHALQAG